MSRIRTIPEEPLRLDNDGHRIVAEHNGFRWTLIRRDGLEGRTPIELMPSKFPLSVPLHCGRSNYLFPALDGIWDLPVLHVNLSVGRREQCASMGTGQIEHEGYQSDRRHPVVINRLLRQ